ncbi:hypothetical protein ACWD4G_04255 [Streptomyces sp. NPDC002643]
MVRWAAFSCVLVPVVLVWYGTSLAGATGAALGLAAVTAVCRILLRQSERGAARTPRTGSARTPRTGSAHTPQAGSPRTRHGDSARTARTGSPRPRHGRSASGARGGGRKAGPSTPVD